jgi:hypothetical protein
MMTEPNNVEYTSVEVAYLEWVAKTMDELKQQNADLLEALKDLVEQWEWQESDEYKNAIKAIAKAEGK